MYTKEAENGFGTRELAKTTQPSLHSKCLYSNKPEWYRAPFRGYTWQEATLMLILTSEEFLCKRPAITLHWGAS